MLTVYQSPAPVLRSPPVDIRKPSGPRPIATSGQQTTWRKGDPNSIKKTRFRGSPDQIPGSEEDY